MGVALADKAKKAGYKSTQDYVNETVVHLWRWMTFRRFLIFFFVIVVPLSIALGDLRGDVLFCSVLMVLLCWAVKRCALKPVERLWRSTCLQTTSVDPMHDSGA